jgi:pimeloyl-ACP methyl ester carboxylesterase
MLTQISRIAFAFLLALSLLQGCAFVKLKRDLTELEAASVISGNIVTDGRSKGPILIVLYQQLENQKYVLSTFTVRYGSGTFRFLRPAGTYFLMAFEDQNEDFQLQNSEPAGWHGAPTLIKIGPGRQVQDIRILLRPGKIARQKLPQLYAAKLKRFDLRYATAKPAEIANLGLPKFSASVGTLGMWQPVKFVEKGYHGIYFLEPYDATKIPVLFVHGLAGFAQNWRSIIAAMDRKKFQPWLVQYPSGLRLSLISERLGSSVSELRSRYGFDDLIVVAHSMGGLVARDFIVRNSRNKRSSLTKLFITLSTPWGGHDAAKSGAKYSPVVVPSWYDLVPGSSFLNSFRKAPLPPQVLHHLLFGYRGENDLYRLFSGVNGDGSVTLKSQLSLFAQQGAVKLIGFDEGHVSILQSQSVIKVLNEILADYVRGGLR